MCISLCCGELKGRLVKHGLCRCYLEQAVSDVLVLPSLFKQAALQPSSKLHSSSCSIKCFFFSSSFFFPFFLDFPFWARCPVFQLACLLVHARPWWRSSISQRARSELSEPLRLLGLLFPLVGWGLDCDCTIHQPYLSSLSLSLRSA